MGKLQKKISKALDCFSFSNYSPSSYNCSSASCFCINSSNMQQYDDDDDDDDEFDKQPLILPSTHNKHQFLTLKDVVNGGNQTLAFQLKPKMVTLKVSIHCRGCARKVEKHISKMEGVSSYTIDLETKMVIIIGDIVPFEVVESVSKVKNAQLWQSSLA